MKKLFFLLLIFDILFCAEFNIDAIMQDEKTDVSQNKIETKKFVQDSKKESRKLNKEFYNKYEYVPPSTKNSNTKHDVFCYSSYIKDDGDKNFCLSFAKNDKSYCYYTELSGAQKNICLGYCYDNSLSKAQKAFCIALKRGDNSFCFDTNLKGSLKAMCLGRFNKVNCYSIANERDKNICLGISLN